MPTSNTSSSSGDRSSASSSESVSIAPGSRTCLQLTNSLRYFNSVCYCLQIKNCLLQGYNSKKNQDHRSINLFILVNSELVNSSSISVPEFVGLQSIYRGRFKGRFEVVSGLGPISLSNSMHMSPSSSCSTAFI